MVQWHRHATTVRGQPWVDPQCPHLVFHSSASEAKQQQQQLQQQQILSLSVDFLIITI